MVLTKHTARKTVTLADHPIKIYANGIAQVTLEFKNPDGTNYLVNLTRAEIAVTLEAMDELKEHLMSFRSMPHEQV